jgi:general secretion pathway protein A
MFLDYYHLREQPFGVTPDPRYLYLSPTHREALASLYYGVEASRGFLALIAEPGMGKTTLLFQLLEQLRESACAAFLFQTQCDSRELLRYLLADMGIDSQGHDLVEMHAQLNDALMRLKRADRRFVLVIDEAQNLDDSVLETVRLLSDFETPSSKLMQIILSGQPQLAAKLARPSLAQLRQRIAILSRLEPFSPAETDRYIDHRLRVAGYDGGALFTSDARAIIAVRSRGIPRNINNLCFNALSMGYALRRKKIDVESVREVIKDLDVESLVREGADAPPIVASGFPAKPPRAFGSKWRGERGLGPFRAAALAASIVLACLFLFPSLWRSLGTQFDRSCEKINNLTQRRQGAKTRKEQLLCFLCAFCDFAPLREMLLPIQGLSHSFDRVVSADAMPVAKSIGLNRPTLPLTVSTTTPPEKSAVVGGAAIGLSRPTLPLTVSATTPPDKSAVVGGAASDTVPSGNPTVVVEVKPSQTLEQISVSHFGRFDRKLLQEIRALNPRITDPDHIETGQRIILPTRTLTSPGTDSAGRAEVEPMTSARN